ncbi:MAG TPA: NAD(P)H-binding protein [Hanamia sp.]|nr:NAD(P)H-binding protein [Hanamia sp.]
MKKVLVTGGTGTLGSEVVKQLLFQQYHTSVLTSRQNPSLPQGCRICNGDLAKNTGLREALQNADIVIHCASNPKSPLETDVRGTRNLMDAIDKNKTHHFIYISIVGIDKSNYPYYKAKSVVEKIIEESGIPFTILRTTQFHNLVLSLIQSFENNDGTILVPSGLRFQSIDVSEVAGYLVAIAKEKPGGLLPDRGGPEILTIEEMTKDYLDFLGRQDALHIKPLESERFDLFRSGINLCPYNKSGKITWKEFLLKQL